MAKKTTLTPSAIPGQVYVFVAKEESVAASAFDFGGWLSQNIIGLAQSQASIRAQIQHSRILDKPETVAFTRNGAKIAAQVVRLEWTDSLTEVDSDLGSATLRRGYVMGFKSHPTLPDLNVQEWDTFSIYDNQYTVTSVNKHLIGQIQAAFEAV